MPKSRKQSKKDKQVLLILLSLLPLIPAFGATLWVSYPFAKRFWSYYWVKQSENFFEEKKYGEAFQKALSAYYWNPYDDVILLNLARKSFYVRHPNTIDWWMEAIDIPERSTEDLVLFIRTAYRYGRNSLSLAYLNRYHTKLPPDLDTWILHVDLLRKSGRSEDAINLITSLVAKGHSEWFLHKAKVRVYLDMQTPESRQMAMEHLLHLIEENDVNAVEALKLFFQFFWKDLGSEEQISIISRIRNQNISEREGRLFPLVEDLRLERLSWADFILALTADFDFENIDDLRAVSHWLTTRGLHKEVIGFVSESRAQQDKTLFLHLYFALLATGEADKAYGMTLETGPENPLSPSENLFARARAQQTLGVDEILLDKTLKLAVQVSAPKEFNTVETQLIHLDKWKLLSELYLRYYEDPTTISTGKSKLLQAYYQLGEEFALDEHLATLTFKDFSTDARSLGLLCYLNVLTGKQLDTTREVLEKIVADFPNFLEFRVLLAFSYLKANQTEIARILLGNHKIPISNYQLRHYELAYVYVKAANRQITEVQEFFDRYQERPLLPQEKRLLNQFNPNY